MFFEIKFSNSNIPRLRFSALLRTESDNIDEGLFIELVGIKFDCNAPGQLTPLGPN